MHKISPFLWFDERIEDAVNCYVSLFPNSRVISTQRNGDSVQMMTFELDGDEVMALNGGPMFKFNEAFSFYVRCEDQAEVDRYWDALTANGGEESQCGWLKDPWGLSWQIVPKALEEGLSDSDPERAQRCLQAMFKMQRLNVAELERARAGTD
jgi:predicted 3-demethylubiquinone-9 3-methyltransferase (glyoxalase superfamily)